ncbi:tryptophan synthase subunit alpha [Blochmannia endosymbiont of Camponotus sp.]|uniref:tryptophan synthase subunit alpha n=1 Tax=Blochmannia endosymbiont of Camponotus sp. TaxID=700220 RepID=UPI002023C0EA|nr:tryptophan synthase subunit alpha [Blochmannia endosymbiont of Camponotus sp.]URJ32473.1 tryptophan synthase subunit alpha [Blochmannia endosymbiont of Camponotus sp.]
MNRYEKLFTHLNQKKLGAFVPFIAVGYPNPIAFMHIIDILVSSGSDALELGIPFSDPISDGPIIQKSMERAFKSGINFSRCVMILHNIRNKYPNLPIGLLIYANLVFKNGINNFYSCCSKLDIDSILIPDLPVEESLPFYNAATQHKIAHIFICPPNATEELIHNITTLGHGYIYLLSRPGVTGIDINTKKIYNTILYNIIKCIQKQKKKLPILQGFGIHTPLQAQESLSLGTSGVITGSKIASIIEKNISNTELAFKKIEKLVRLMKTSMRSNIN